MSPFEMLGSLQHLKYYGGFVAHPSSSGTQFFPSCQHRTMTVDNVVAFYKRHTYAEEMREAILSYEVGSIRNSVYEG
jgi:hypothetical protein